MKDRNQRLDDLVNKIFPVDNVHIFEHWDSRIFSPPTEADLADDAKRDAADDRREENGS